MRRFCDDEFTFSYMATIGVDFKIRTLDLEVDGVAAKVKLQMWDTAGQERFNSITKSFYRGADIMVVVYDVTSHHTFTHVKKWMAGCTEVCGDTIPTCLVGNKSDLAQHREVEIEAGRELANRMGSEGQRAVFVETSAKEGLGVVEAFEQMAIEFVRRERAATSRSTPRAGNGIGSISRARGEVGGAAVDLKNDPSPGCMEFFRKVFSVFSKPKLSSSISAPVGSSVDSTPQKPHFGRGSNGVGAFVPAL
jgi:small GTP-binding protein